MGQNSGFCQPFGHLCLLSSMEFHSSEFGMVGREGGYLLIVLGPFQIFRAVFFFFFQIFKFSDCFPLFGVVCTPMPPMFFSLSINIVVSLLKKMLIVNLFG